MNYRHAYHAGNFADVVKHAVLSLAIAHLKLKPKPFRMVDTHAGAGLYDLGGSEAARTGEWRDGIGRLVGPEASPLDEPGAADLLAPYLDVVRGINDGGVMRAYPGSPLLARRMMRSDDVLIANELHPDDQVALRQTLARAPNTKVMALDGWTAVRALLPPKERRGLTLIDPPFEQRGEFERLALAATDAAERFATGMLLLWYPIKDVRAVSRFHAKIFEANISRTFCAELWVRTPRDQGDLAGCGLVINNPPHTFEKDLAVLLPFLSRRFAQGRGAGWRAEWLLR